MTDLAPIDHAVDVARLRGPGVYLLVREGRVVYVGQSKNPLSRIGQHSRSFAFDRVLFISEPNDSERTAIEAALVRRLDPLESGYASKKTIKRDPEILARFGLTFDPVTAAAARARSAKSWSVDARAKR